MSTTRQQIVAKIYDRKGRLLATGRNSYTKTHPMQARYARILGGRWSPKVYLHAEIAALVQLSRSDRRVRQADSIFIQRINRQGLSRLAAPCPVCTLALQQAGVKKGS